MELLFRVVFSLGAVLCLVWFLSRAASRRLGGTRASVVRLVGRQSLGRASSVAVVAVGERMLVVGVTESGVRLLTELDADEIDLPTVAPLLSGSRREREPATPEAAAPATGLVPSGSVLAPATWRQAWHAATARGGPQT